MNDDPSPSSVTRAGPSVDSNPDHVLFDNDAAADDGSPEHPLVQRYDTSAGAESLRQERRRRKKKKRKKRNPGLKKKLAFVTHLLKGLDSLVFAELSAMYYMECSMFRFMIRAAGQFMYLSPKDETFPFLMPASRVHVALVVLPNVWCILMHLFGALPVGRDYDRGYMHGGLIIDFVGQKPPTYRIYYLLADLFLFALQCLMLSVHTERERLRVSLKTFRPLYPDSTAMATLTRTIEEADAEERQVGDPPNELDAYERAAQDQGDDLDAGEQSTRDRSASLSRAENEDGDIELQPLRRSLGSRRHRTEATDDSELLTSSNEDVSRSHLSDILNSGNAVLGEYHVVNSMHTAAVSFEQANANSLRTLGYEATLAAIEARRRRAYVDIRSRRQRNNNA